MERAPVNRIIPFSNVDGPGNRTAVFFQSCPFSCLYCHNPETIRMCCACGACVETCPVQALKLEKGKVVWDPAICIGCDTCLKTCTHLASPKIQWMTVKDVMKTIRTNKDFIEGITVSGGECMNQADFLLELFKACKKEGLTCLIDSNGAYDFEQYPELLEVCDGVMLDVKASDPQTHQALCHAENTVVLKNLDFLLAQNKLEEVRTVLFPNKTRQNQTTVTYVATHLQDQSRYKLIKYRPFGVRQEGLDFLGPSTTSDEELNKMVKIALKCGCKQVVTV